VIGVIGGAALGDLLALGVHCWQLERLKVVLQ
jgi:hypothetical protein